MRPDSSVAALPLFPDRYGQLVLAGYGCRLAVERGRLVALDGIATNRRADTIGRADGLRRLVVLGHTGTITLDVLRWCADTGAALVVIDPDGRLLTVAGSGGRDEPALRRAQALAPHRVTGPALVRDLLGTKLAGQRRVVATLPNSADAADLIVDLGATLARVKAINDLRLIEAQAAAAYWSIVARTPMSWATHDRGRVPAAWHVIGPRRSPLTGSARRAITPAHAMLNYLNAIAEAEARLACLAVGLDPGLGVLHADLTARDSMALDLLEVGRPDVEAFLLDVLARRTFGAREFGERPDGVIRVGGSLAVALASTGPRWRAVLGPWAERVAHALLDGQPTPLTGARRAAARPSGSRPRSPHQASPGQLALPATCATCGAPVGPRRRTCDTCLAAGRATALVAGPGTLADLRAAGRDPAHGGSAAIARGRSNARRSAERAAWRGSPGDPERFRAEVLPRIQGVTLAVLAERTGLTLGYLGRIRGGRYVPHARWWKSLVGAEPGPPRWGTPTLSRPGADRRPEDAGSR